MQNIRPFKIGDSARVGANAVVTKPIESNSTVMGIPAKMINKSKENKEKSFTAYGTPTNIDIKKNNLKNKRKNKK